MADNSTLIFTYRQKSDGSGESICLMCFKTILAGNADDLPEQERKHQCAPWDLLGYTGKRPYRAIPLMVDDRLEGDSSKF